jgi:hypothetical protein
MSASLSGVTGVLRVGEVTHHLHAGYLRVILQSLLVYDERQSRRVAEAVAAGELPHADQRQKQRQLAATLIDLFVEGGIPLPNGCRVPKIGDLPSASHKAVP